MDLLRIISALHPIPSEPTARLQRCREFGAGVGGGSTVLLAPDSGSGAPFSGACVVFTEASTGDLEMRHHQLKFLTEKIFYIPRTARSNCVLATSVPVLVAWTIIFLPEMGPLVKVSW